MELFGVFQINVSSGTAFTIASMLAFLMKHSWKGKLLFEEKYEDLAKEVRNDLRSRVRFLTFSCSQ